MCTRGSHSHSTVQGRIGWQAPRKARAERRRGRDVLELTKCFPCEVFSMGLYIQRTEKRSLGRRFWKDDFSSMHEKKKKEWFKLSHQSPGMYPQRKRLTEFLLMNLWLSEQLDSMTTETATTWYSRCPKDMASIHGSLDSWTGSSYSNHQSTRKFEPCSDSQVSAPMPRANVCMGSLFI